MDLPMDSPLRPKIAIIQNSGQKAASMVQDLLSLARRCVIMKEVFNMNTIIEDYLASPEFNAIKRHHSEVHIKTYLSTELLSLRGASVHLSKVLMNLIGNSAEAMPSGGCIFLFTCNIYLDVSISAYETIPEGEYVRLSIADEGIGISQDDIKRIFDPFYTKKRWEKAEAVWA